MSEEGEEEAVLDISWMPELTDQMCSVIASVGAEVCYVYWKTRIHNETEGQRDADSLVPKDTLLDCANRFIGVLLKSVRGAQLLRESSITFHLPNSGLGILLQLLLGKGMFTVIFLERCLEYLQSRDLKQSLQWTPRAHSLFHEDCRSGIFTLLACWSIENKREDPANHPASIGIPSQSSIGIPDLPLEVLFNIFKWVCCPPFNVIKRCASCGAPETPETTFKRCGQCKLVVYCNAMCQREDWKHSHRESCEQYVKLSEPEGNQLEYLLRQLTPSVTDPKYASCARLVENGRRFYLEEDTNKKRKLKK